jgi:bacteriorhodopsin/CheY-like chemotaxis protein
MGSPSENAALGLEWFDFVTGFALFLFFVYQKKMKNRCKFEVLYVTGVGAFTDWMKIFLTKTEPAQFTIEETGLKVNWSRWVGWLITCPVILIHLSNLAGREVFDVRRLMKMFIAFQIMCLGGATASMTHTGMKYLFAIISWGSMMIIFKHAADIFNEANATMPAKAKPHLQRLAFIFFSTWALFGVFFCLSAELSNMLDMGVARAAYAFLDFWSKNGYAYTGWYIRWNILRKAEKPEEFVDEIKDEDDAKKYKVLLIEPDEVFAYFFFNTLQQQDCEVDTVKTVPEAVQKITTVFLSNHQYDVIMISHDLAKADNYAHMQDVRRAAFMLPVIAYGRTITPEDINNRSATGIDDFLVAPFPDQEIARKLLKWSRRMSLDPRKMSMVPITNPLNRAHALMNYQSPLPPVAEAAPAKLADGEKPANPNAGIEAKLELLMASLEEVKKSSQETTADLARRMDQAGIGMQTQQQFQQPQTQQQFQQPQTQMPQPQGQIPGQQVLQQSPVQAEMNQFLAQNGIQRSGNSYTFI